jgi:hypothetical protein
LAQFTDIFAVPKSELSGLEASYDALRDRYPWHGVAGFSSLHWTLAAQSLGLEHTAPGDPLVFDEEAGMAMFVWSAEFLSWLRLATAQQRADLAGVLAPSETFSRVTTDDICDALSNLSSFVLGLSPESVVVEYATF